MHALFKMVRYVLLRFLWPDLDCQDLEASSPSRWTGQTCLCWVDEQASCQLNWRRRWTPQYNRLIFRCSYIVRFYALDQFINPSPSVHDQDINLLSAKVSIIKVNSKTFGLTFLKIQGQGVSKFETHWGPARAGGGMQRVPQATHKK
jgi:hypothetical protein